MEEKIPIKLTKPGKLPYVELYYTDAKYRFVIDTGSTLSWTTPAMCGMILMKHECSYDKIVVNNGEQLNVVNATLRLSPTDGTSNDFTAPKFRASFACGEGSEKIAQMNEVLKHEVHGILGSEFLLDNMLKVDLKNMEITI